MEGRSVKLIETLLYGIGESLMQRTWPGAALIEVAVRKCNPPMSPSCEYTEVTEPMAKAVIALGSNLGDRRAHLAHARRFLSTLSSKCRPGVIHLRNRAGRGRIHPHVPQCGV
jgi:hypothetical protein